MCKLIDMLETSKTSQPQRSYILWQKESNYYRSTALSFTVYKVHRSLNNSLYSHDNNRSQRRSINVCALCSNPGAGLEQRGIRGGLADCSRLVEVAVAACWQVIHQMTQSCVTIIIDDEGHARGQDRHVSVYNALS